MANRPYSGDPNSLLDAYDSCARSWIRTWRPRQERKPSWIRRQTLAERTSFYFRNMGPRRATEHTTGSWHSADRRSCRPMFEVKPQTLEKSEEPLLLWKPLCCSGLSVELLVPDKQESLDRLLRRFHRRNTHR